MVRVVAPSFTGMRNGIDNSAVGCVANIPYEIPNIYADYHAPYVTPDVLNDFRPVGFGIPVDYWRAPGANANAYFTESFIDELAAAAGKDPIEFRKPLLSKNPRLLATMQLAAEKAGWGKPLPAGHFQGVATGGGSGSLSTQIEISIEKGKVKVHRIVTAVAIAARSSTAAPCNRSKAALSTGSHSVEGAITIEKAE
jgi:isoquinoline 1-oxidoreductase beta subunit